MVSKFEAIGLGASVILMAVALYLLRVETTILGVATSGEQTAAALSTVVVEGDGTTGTARVDALMDAVDSQGRVTRLVVEDITPGTGAEAKVGDTLLVHYIGTLQDGTEFDNSQKRGAPFAVTLGEGRVIAGWEQGLLGMKAGGQRILVIPASLGYGERAMGPIPPNSTLVFSIELVSIE